jgi:hypothetical protein
MSYTIGGRLRFGNHEDSGVAAFTDLNDVVTDPTEVVLTIRCDDGSTKVYGYPSEEDDGLLTREAAGRFYVDVTLDVPGVWRIKLDGTGTVVASRQATITVERSLVA